MEKFVLAGKAKTVFHIIDLMAKGEELKKKQKADRMMKGSLGEKTVGEILDMLRGPGVRVFHGLIIDDNMGS
ncbi:hypothetical protein ACFLVJ_02045 [Chloroflexota bacterium]